MPAAFVSKVTLLLLCVTGQNWTYSVEIVDSECHSSCDGLFLDCSWLHNTSDAVTCTDLQQHRDSCLLGKNALDGLSNQCQPAQEWNAAITYNLTYRDERSFYINLQWIPHPNISQYTLAITIDEPWREVEEDKDDYCFTEVNQTTTQFTHVLPYQGSDGDNSKDIAYVEIIPQGWCNGVTLEIAVPLDCYMICPGMCSCITTYSKIYPSPKNVTATYSSHESISTVTVKWELGAKYHAPRLNMAFYLRILYNGERVSKIIVVKEKINVSLQVMYLDTLKNYKIGVSEHLCEDKLSKEKIVPLLYTSSSTTSSTLHSTDHSISPTAIIISSNLLPETTKTTATQTIATINSNGILITSTSVLMPTVTTNNPSIVVTNGHAQIGTLTTLFIITVLVLVISLIILILIVKKRRQRSLTKPQDSIYKDNYISKEVLVLFSQASSTYDEECIMENIIKALNLYRVNCVFFDKPCVKGTVTDWVISKVHDCHRVLMVCNKEFITEWKSHTITLVHGDSIVYVANQIISSYVSHDKHYLDKFAVLYLRKKDLEYVDCPILKNMKSFLVDPQDKTQLEQTIRFIDNTPTYILP